jgi:mannosyl-3-phosphoglycerate phosphatase
MDRYPVVFTDLDGTLLDEATYGWEAAAPALERCRSLDIPVVPVSSKTFSEIEPLRRELRLEHPFVTENGGGIFFPRARHPDPPSGSVPDGDYWKHTAGASRDELRGALSRIREDLGWKIEGFSDMSIARIAELTQLGLSAAAAAAERDFDEPFVFLEGPPADLTPLFQAAETYGFQVTPGGRFFHLHGKSDKGSAFRIVSGCYRERRPELVTIALGDAENDWPMLEQADYPVFCGGKSRKIPPIRRLRIAAPPGPAGWNTAVLDILARLLPSLG